MVLSQNVDRVLEYAECTHANTVMSKPTLA
jgi:hypothetical protein